MNLAAFRARFPEYDRIPDPIVSSALSDALAGVNTEWGTEADLGQGLLAAHYLALSPSGAHARLTSDKAETTYGRQYERLVWKITTGERIFP